MSTSGDIHSEEGSGPLVLVVYQDFGSGACVPSVLQLIDKEVGAEDQIQVAECRFDSFQEPEKKDQAAQLAQRADIIIVASASDSAMPAPVQSWFDQWIGRRENQPGALVAVFAPTSDQPAELCNASLHLRNIARAAGMDYFCTSFNENTSRAAAPATCLPIEAPIPQRAVGWT